MKGIGMKKYSGICAAAAIVAATVLQGCLPAPLHTQDFAAGEVDLQGKQLYFMPATIEGAENYNRAVVDITALGNDPAGDTVADVSGGSFTLTLDAAHAVSFYGALITDLVLGANGTIGMGAAGDNTDLTAHFMHKQVSLLPVDDAGVPAGSVTYDIVDTDGAPSSVAVTYNGVTAGAATATAQAEFFFGEAFGDIALSYTVLSADAAGVYGLSNGQLIGADEATISSFLANFANQPALTVEQMTAPAA